jgi:F-type H+-transporting ATPase subunit c
MLFGKVYESNSRQPEMAADLIGLQWLGFALTEATFFYGLVGGLIGYVLA